ncbi:hypothetical protein BD324DRAFT_492952 [Kockovaella imperatae]|uniref:CUE domain-containing protein n=1 Tax=Kockovaella imperatae TaxID=4999 RepID=A0A1Y1UEA6_9TREE|nr:hypothetical protein BD324DRAFT_492952 [Kockovaella imperatae]ORX36390.1 hypothetical protein BD324DRAFT_492952 [Kockovaella imperatae]
MALPWSDIITSVLVIGTLYLLVRWFSKRASSTPNTGIRGVNLSMVETVKSAFPDIPAPNIIYSLSKTRSAQATSEEILERGFLPNPPASFEVPSSLLPPSSTQPVPSSAQSKSDASSKPQQSLIERYGLSSQLPTRKGKEREHVGDEDASGQAGPVQEASQRQSSTGGKWEDTKEKREMDLRQRKEKMILEARRRMLEKQAQAEATAGNTEQPTES